MLLPNGIDKEQRRKLESEVEVLDGVVLFISLFLFLFQGFVVVVVIVAAAVAVAVSTSADMFCLLPLVLERSC